MSSISTINVRENKEDKVISELPFLVLCIKFFKGLSRGFPFLSTGMWSSHATSKLGVFFFFVLCGELYGRRSLPLADGNILVN